MAEHIIVDQKVTIWNRFRIEVPKEMTKEEFIDHLYEEDPYCSDQENFDFEPLYGTEEVLKTEFYADEDGLINDPIKVWNESD